MLGRRVLNVTLRLRWVGDRVFKGGRGGFVAGGGRGGGGFFAGSG